MDSFQCGFVSIRKPLHVEIFADVCEELVLVIGTVRGAVQFDLFFCFLGCSHASKDTAGYLGFGA